MNDRLRDKAQATDGGHSMMEAGEHDVDKMDTLTNKVQDHSTVLQALQVDMRHAVKLLDKLVIVADKQTDLAHELSRHSDSIERAFKHTDGVESKLVKAIDALTDVFKKDRDKADATAETVTGYRSSLKTLMYVGGAVTGLLFLVGGMFSAQQVREIDRTNQSVSDIAASAERRKLAVDIKLDNLVQQVQEVRLDRQRDRESVELPSTRRTP